MGLDHSVWNRRFGVWGILMSFLAVIAILVALSGMAAAQLTSGDSRTIINSSDLSNCTNVTILVSPPADIGNDEYNLTGCTEIELNKWFCEVTPGFEVVMTTKTTSIDDYSITFACDIVNGIPIGTPTDIEVCQSVWTPCVGDLSYKYCYQGLLNTTKVKNCTTNITCSPDWQCGNWSLCISGTMTQSCTELNQCWTTSVVLSKSCNCFENWDCGSWSSCFNGSQQRNCSDAHMCGTTYNQPSLSRSCACTEDWQCSGWGSCINGSQSRICTDLNGCGTLSGKPSESQSCEATCQESWHCAAWSSCRPNSTEARNCTDSNHCNTSVSKPAESKSCTYSGGGGGGGGGGNPEVVGGGGSGWICDPYGPCINGRRSAFCYRDTRNSGLNYTVSENCTENTTNGNKTNETKPAVNETEPPVIILPGENATGNQTVPPKKGPTGITGLLGLLVPKQPWQWALLTLVVLALIGFGLYRWLMGSAATGSAGKKGKK